MEPQTAASVVELTLSQLHVLNDQQPQQPQSESINNPKEKEHDSDLIKNPNATNVINNENVQNNSLAQQMQPNGIENTENKHKHREIIIIPSSTNSPSSTNNNNSPSSSDLVKNSSSNSIENDDINQSEINGHAMSGIAHNESSNESVQIIAFKPSAQIAECYDSLIQPQKPNIDVLNINDNNDKKSAQQNLFNNTTKYYIDMENNKVTAAGTEHKSDNKNRNNPETAAAEPNSNEMDVDEINEMEQTENNNDFGIGTEQNSKKQVNVNNTHNNNKQEMDIDEEDNINELVPRRKQQQQQQNNTPNVQNAQQSITNNNNNEKPFGMMDYDEELDEDFNAAEAEAEAEEEEDDSSDHSEDIINDGDGDGDDDSNDLADIDIVNDDKLYTEEAPRWLVNAADIENAEKEFNTEAAYEDWERDKEAGLYSDAENVQESNNMNDEKPGSLMDYYLTKYCSKQDKRRNSDPEKDKIKKKGGDYQLDDNFIDDGDCFVLNNVETLHCGFFISKGNVDVKNYNSPKAKKLKLPKSSKKKTLPDIPHIYLHEINRIATFVRNNRSTMVHICNDREMPGIIKNKHLYTKQNENKESNAMYDQHTVATYHKLLTMLLEFDTTLLREKAKNKTLSGDLKFAIYHQLTPIFGYAADSYRRQQNKFEELLNWFSYDWYDADDDMQSKKINWRNLFLHELKKRAKARFHNKMNKKRKDEGGKGKKDKLAQASDIPWDSIVSDVFLITCYCMETAALADNDIDEARHQFHMSLRDSIGKYLEVGNAGVSMGDIEKRYNAQKQAFAANINGSYCYSYLVVERIKQNQRNEKRNKSPRKKPKRSFRPEKPVVDLTNNKQMIVSPPPLTPVPNDIDAATQEIKSRPSTGFFAQHSNNNNMVNSNNSNNNDATTNNVIDLTGANGKKPVPHNTRKRRRHEMESIAAPESTQELQTFSPPTKKRRTDTNNDDNGIMYPNPEAFMEIGSLIGIAEKGGLQNGVSIAVITRIGDRVWYRDYKTEAVDSCEYGLCYLMVPYVDKTQYLKGDTVATTDVLVLTQNVDGSFDTKYVVAQVTEQTDSLTNGNDNDYGVICIQCKEENMEMPLFTFIQSATYKNWERTKIATVIRIVPLIGSEFANKVNKHKTDLDNDNDKTANNSNGNAVPISCEPPSSNMFCRNLPNDPWNDRHFQGLEC